MRRTDVAVVQPYVERSGRLGQREYVPQGPTVRVACNAYPVDATLSETLGLTRSITRQVFADRWPFDEFARVVELHVRIPGRGLELVSGTWEQTAPAEHFTHTSRPHSTVIIRKG